MRLLKLLPLAGVLLFIAIIYNLKWSDIYLMLVNTNPVILLLAISLQMPVILSKALKWKILANPYNAAIPLKEAVIAWLVGFSAGLVTPGRMGDLVRAYYIKKDIATGKALTTVVVDRVIDVLVLFFFSFIGIMIFVSVYASGTGTASFISILLVSLAFLLSGLYLFSKKHITARIARPFFNRLPDKYKKKARKTFHDFYGGLSITKKGRSILLISVIIGILSWLVMIFQTYVLSLSLNTGLPLLFLACTMPLVTLLDALPISFSGVGTRDAALIFFFSFLSLSPEAAVSFSLMLLVFNYMLPAAAGFVFWMRNPVKIGSG